jgi:DNA-directed RNA polymerase specialized sigma24 family protein
MAAAVPEIGEWKGHTVTADLTARARAGDQDAEDALQETLLAAWRGLASFEERASVRTWLYRIATSRCLNTLPAGSRTSSRSRSWPSCSAPVPSPPGCSSRDC